MVFFRALNVYFSIDGLHRKFQTALLQQTLLIRTCFYVLLHLSEDPGVEDKMRKKGIVSLLTRALQRKHLHPSMNGMKVIFQTDTETPCFCYRRA